MRGLRFFRFRLVSISVLFSYDRSSARMVELVDTRDLKSVPCQQIKSRLANGFQVNRRFSSLFQFVTFCTLVTSLIIPSHFFNKMFTGCLHGDVPPFGGFAL